MKKIEEQGFIEGRLENDGKAIVNILGRWYLPEEVEQVEKQNAVRMAETVRETKKVWKETPQGKLCLALYEAFRPIRTIWRKIRLLFG